MLYFLRNNNKIKIGYASNPNNRISEIQTSNPDELECLLLLNGGYEDEYKLHLKFINHRLRNNSEWFNFTDDIFLFIRENLWQDKRYEYGLTESEPRGNEQIKRLRRKQNLTLGMLGDKLEMSAAGVKELENREEKGNITIKKLKKVASTLGYDFQYRFISK